MSEKFNWDNTAVITKENFVIDAYFLETDFGKEKWKDNPCYFLVDPFVSSESNTTYILFYRNREDIYDNDKAFEISSDVGVDTAKKIVENTIKYFTIEDFRNDYIDGRKYFNTERFEQHINRQISDLHLETAQKTGYVQGVCESVLAFNTDENKKIMTEATMTFLSKKLLSEMNVTKDMAQKFANPETYKALEQSVFAPKQEQQLEQTQSLGRGM